MTKKRNPKVATKTAVADVLIARDPDSGEPPIAAVTRRTGIPTTVSPSLARFVIGIDPGTVYSGVVVFDVSQRVAVGAWSAVANKDMIDGRWLVDLILKCQQEGDVHIAVERFVARGAAVDSNSITTVLDTGRLLGMLAVRFPDVPVATVSRPDVALMLCGRRAGDSEINTAVADRFGGDKQVAKGTKKLPGPLFLVSGHAWAAMAVVTVYIEYGVIVPREPSANSVVCVSKRPEASLEVVVRGHGNCCVEGDSPVAVFVGCPDGGCDLLVLADINSEKPTHTISLEGARRAKRRNN